MPLWASPWKPLLLLHQGYIEYRGYILWGYVMTTLCLLCQPGERFCYGCLSLFLPSQSHFACAGLSWQCDQQDSWHHEHYQQYTAINWKLVFGYAACRVLGPQPGIKIAPLRILITGPLGHLLETLNLHYYVSIGLIKDCIKPLWPFSWASHMVLLCHTCHSDLSCERTIFFCMLLYNRLPELQ